ncbi:hypothetical protein B0H17DRAFT_1127660 [Mycena rosella]|uniref:Uncharacterized protein n=1 Tax=Mycena rosella TaxID=1033263 RepID=A0AAD7GN23_MYCRO|nr:hypothetical protein B0H17DRAFT_1127660 [Mycena rosella]
MEDLLNWTPRSVHWPVADFQRVGHPLIPSPMSLKMVPDDPTRCVGRAADGTQCICKHCSQKSVVDGRTICDNCGHIESAHPEPQIGAGSLIRQFRDAGRLSITSKSSTPLSPKATAEEAQTETNSNLRKKKRKPATDTEPPSKKRAKHKESTKQPKGENIEVGHVAALVYGMNGSPGNPTLKQTKAPNKKDINFMVQHGLAKRATPDHPIIFNTSWDTERCTRFFRTLLPHLFSHLDSHPPKADPTTSLAVQEQQWLAVIKTNQSVSLSGEELPTGADLAFNCKTRGIGISDRILYIATKIKVSSDRYVDWDIESDSEGPEAEENFDMLDDSNASPQKPTAKSRGKAKAEASGTPEKNKIVASVVKVEKPEPSLPDMKLAAKMRTRLDTKTIKWNTVHIPHSSDDERPDHIEVSDDDEAELPHASALLASAQPSSSKISSSQASPDLPSFGALNQSFSPEHSIFTEDDFNFTSLPPSPPGNSSGWASTSSGASTSSQMAATSLPSFASYAPPPVSTFTPSWSVSSTATPSMPASASPIPPAAPTPAPLPTPIISTSTSGAAGGSLRPAPFFKRGGKSKGVSNPWKQSS